MFSFRVLYFWYLYYKTNSMKNIKKLTLLPSLFIFTILFTCVYNSFAQSPWAYPGGPTDFCTPGTTFTMGINNPQPGATYDWYSESYVTFGGSSCWLSVIGDYVGSGTIITVDPFDPLFHGSTTFMCVEYLSGNSSYAGPVIMHTANSRVPICFTTNSCGFTTLQIPHPTWTIGANIITWYCNSIPVAVYNNQAPYNPETYLATQTGYYQCMVTTDCGQHFSDSVYVVAPTNPLTATITPAGPTTFCPGGSVLLNANTGAGYTYKWKKNGSAITGATSPSYTATTAGNYTVELKSGNCSVTSANAVVSISTFPSATVYPSGPTSVCTGSVVLSTTNPAGYTFQWKKNGVNIAGATTNTYTAAASGSYTVLVTNATGCSTTSAATVVTIGALVAAVVPPGPVTLCSGNSVTCYATYGSGFTYQWYRNNLPINATLQAFTTSTQGTYKCVITSGTCSSTSNSVVINVNTTPAATVSYSTPLSFCSPGSVTFTANALSGASYQWENNSVAIAGATAQTYTATTAGAYRIKETKNGCTGYSSVKTVTSATSVTAAITTADPTTQCTGGTVNMSITSPIPGYSYQWKNNTVNIAGATANTYAATATGNYTVTATASCGTATSNVIAVTIGTLSAVVTPTGNATLCNGGSLTLTANTGSGYGYQWKKNNVNIAGATANTYTVTTAGSYTVAITSPCGNATSAATVVTQAGAVTAAVTPAGASTVCSGSSITLTANTGTGYTYKWYRNNVLLSATTQTYTTGTAGSYKVEVSISGSCAVQSNTATLMVINNTTPTITAGGPTTFCAGQSVTFTANTYAGVAQQWQKNSVNIAGATAATYIATTAGSYRVQQTANGCSKFSSKKVVTVNCRLSNDGVEVSSDETNTTTMEVYPNPFADKLNITITSPITEQTEIKVMDVLGKTMFTQTITTNTAIELNAQLPAGIYMINTIVDGQMKTVRVVKTK